MSAPRAKISSRPSALLPTLMSLVMTPPSPAQFDQPVLDSVIEVGLRSQASWVTATIESASMIPIEFQVNIA